MNDGTLPYGFGFSFFLLLQVGSMSWERDWSLRTMATIPWGARPSEVPILQPCTSPSAASPALGLGTSLLIPMQKRSSPSAPCWLVVRESILLYQEKARVSAKLLFCPKTQQRYTGFHWKSLKALVKVSVTNIVIYIEMSNESLWCHRIPFSGQMKKKPFTWWLI